MCTILKKKVIVEPTSPINLNKDLKIVRTTGPIELSIGNIQRCMLSRARVFEILEDGTKIMLYTHNYKKDNSNLQKTGIKVNSASAQQKANAAVNNATIDKNNKVEAKPAAKVEPVDKKVDTKPVVDNKVESKVDTKPATEGKSETVDKKENNK